jgi:hypothetical protein
MVGLITRVVFLPLFGLFLPPFVRDWWQVNLLSPLSHHKMIHCVESRYQRKSKVFLAKLSVLHLNYQKRYDIPFLVRYFIQRLVVF